MALFKFRYYKTSEAKYNAPEVIERSVDIIAESAPAAVDVFEASIGNLRTKYTLIDIQEYQKGQPYGKPIVLKETRINGEII